MITKTQKPMALMIVEVIGVGVAIACIFWVLGHLAVFYFSGYIVVGEENRIVLFGEIALITSGLLCFIADFWFRKTSKP